MPEKIKFEDVDPDSLDIKCPSCKTVLKTVLRMHRGVIVQSTVYICPACHCLLPIASEW